MLAIIGSKGHFLRLYRCRKRGEVVEYCNTLFKFANPSLVVVASLGTYNADVNAPGSPTNVPCLFSRHTSLLETYFLLNIRPESDWKRGVCPREFGIHLDQPLKPNELPSYVEHKYRFAGRRTDDRIALDARTWFYMPIFTTVQLEVE